MPISQRHRDFVSLLPQFLTVRRSKWAGLQYMLRSNALERPHFFLLRELVEETDRVYFAPWPPLTTEELDNMYTSLKSVCDALSV